MRTRSDRNTGLILTERAGWRLTSIRAVSTDEAKLTLRVQMVLFGHEPAQRWRPSVGANLGSSDD